MLELFMIRYSSEHFDLPSHFLFDAFMCTVQQQNARKAYGK